MKIISSKITGKTNDLVATLVLHRGIIGAASLLAVHAFAFATGRQPGQRTWAGIRRAVSH